MTLEGVRTRLLGVRVTGMRGSSVRLLAGLLFVALVAITLTSVGPAGVALAQREPTDAAADADDRLRLQVRSPLLKVDEDGVPGTARVRATLSEPADLRIRITDADGRLVRELLDGPRAAGGFERRWNGRDDGGQPVPRGPYLAVATAVIGDERVRVERPLAVVSGRVYPRAPELITIVVDPGHGGPRPGAQGADGTREADLNLDISRRLALMLEAAGTEVVLTRTTDAPVNEPPIDRSRDGIADDTDELAARNDIANVARADLFISVHNNSAVNTAVGGPSTFWSDERTFRDRSARLARIVQREIHDALSEYAAGGWEPYDHGALTYPYFVLRDVDPPRLRRPTQMPGVLSEGMFLTNPRELRLLKRPLVRQRMAVAYYDAIAAYLDGRGSHVGYELVSGPTELTAGERAVFEVEVRNSGTTPIRGWTLPVGAIREPEFYEGRGRPGETVGRARIPRLAPGRTATVRVRITAPEREGTWNLLFDARARDGTRMSRRGAPMLQVPVTVVAPPPSPESSLSASTAPSSAAPAG